MRLAALPVGALSDLRPASDIGSNPTTHTFGPSSNDRDSALKAFQRSVDCAAFAFSVQTKRLVPVNRAAFLAMSGIGNTSG